MQKSRGRGFESDNWRASSANSFENDNWRAPSATSSKFYAGRGFQRQNDEVSSESNGFSKKTFGRGDFHKQNDNYYQQQRGFSNNYSNYGGNQNNFGGDVSSPSNGYAGGIGRGTGFKKNSEENNKTNNYQRGFSTNFPNDNNFDDKQRKNFDGFSSSGEFTGGVGRGTGFKKSSEENNKKSNVTPTSNGFSSFGQSGGGFGGFGQFSDVGPFESKPPSASSSNFYSKFGSGFPKLDADDEKTDEKSKMADDSKSFPRKTFVFDVSHFVSYCSF